MINGLNGTRPANDEQANDSEGIGRLPKTGNQHVTPPMSTTAITVVAATVDDSTDGHGNAPFVRAVATLSRRLFRRIAYPPPLTRGYRLRAALLKLSGFDVDPSVRCVSSARFYIDDLSISAGTFIGHDVRIYGGPGSRVTIMENVDIAPSVLILAGTHEIGSPARRAGRGVGTMVEVGPGTWIGAGAIVVGPSRIGRGCVIGAGAIVRGDVDDGTLYRSAENAHPLEKAHRNVR